MELIDKSAVEKILKELWIEDGELNPEHRVCYNKALQEVQCELDTLEVKEVNLEKILIGFQNRYAHENSGELPSAIEIAKHFFLLGSNNFCKPANGNDLPEIDREVIALTWENEHYKVVFAHRPPEHWKGKNLLTGEVTTYTPKRYDKGCWNQPNVKWWLDFNLPIKHE